MIMSFMALVPNVCCAGGIGQACTDEARHQRTRGCKTFFFTKHMCTYIHLIRRVLRSLPAHSSHIMGHHAWASTAAAARRGPERAPAQLFASTNSWSWVIAALAAPSWKRSATCAGRELSGRIEGRERRQAMAKAKAALAAVDKATAMGKTLDRKDTFAEKASPHKKRLSATGTRSTEWRASTWVA